MGLARWAGVQGGGAAGDAGMGRVVAWGVVARLLVALGLLARGGWLDGVREREREGERERERKRESNRERNKIGNSKK